MAKFKWSDEFTALLKAERDAGYEAGYDVGLRRFSSTYGGSTRVLTIGS